MSDARIKGIEFSVTGNMGDTKSQIDSLKKSITQLKNALSGMSGGMKAVRELVEQLGSLPLEGVGNVSGMVSALAGLKDVRVSATVAKHLEGIVAALDGLDDTKVGLLERLSGALKGMDGLKVPSFSEVSNIPDGQAERLEGIVAALDGLDGLKVGLLERLSEALKGMDGLKVPSLSEVSVTIPDGQAERLEGIVAALDGLDDTKVGLLERLSEALKGMDGLKVPSLSKVSTKIPDGQADDGRPTEAGLPFNEAVPEEVSMDWAERVPTVFERIRDAAGPAAAAVADFAGRLGLARIGAAALKALGNITLKGAVAGMKGLGKATLATAGALADIGKRGVSALKSLVSVPFRAAVKPVKGFTDALHGLIAKIGRVAYMRLLRSGIRAVSEGLNEGIQNLYSYSRALGTAFAGSMDSISSSLAYMKNSLAAMAAPIVNALAPAVNFLIDRFVDLMNMINQVVSAFTGKTFTKAKRTAVVFSAEDTASEGAKTAKAVKDTVDDIKKTIFGFDEINIFDRQNTSSSSGGSSGGGSGSGSGTDYSSMFEEAQINPEIKNLVEDIKAAIEDGDWYGAGEILADKLNGLVEKWDTKRLGRKVAAAVNNGLSFTEGFLDKFSFTTLGNRIGEFISTGILGIRWGQVGAVIAKLIGSLGDLIIGTVATVNWGKAGKSLSDFVSGFLNALSDWFDRKSGDGIKVLTEAVSNLLGGIRIKDVMSSLGRFLGSLADAVIAALDGLLSRDWKLPGLVGDMLKGLKKAIDGIPVKDLAERFGKLINRMVENTNIDVITDAIASAVNAAVTFGKDFLSRVDFENAGKKIGQFISDGIGKIKWKNVAKLIAEGLTGIGDTVIGLVTNVNWGSVGKKLGDFAGTLFKKLGGWLIEKSGTLIDGMTKAIRDVIGGIKASQFFKGVWTLIKGILTGAWHLAGGILKLVLSLIFEDIPDLLNGIVKELTGYSGVSAAGVGSSGGINVVQEKTVETSGSGAAVINGTATFEVVKLDTSKLKESDRLIDNLTGQIIDTKAAMAEDKAWVAIKGKVTEAKAALENHENWIELKGKITEAKEELKDQADKVLKGCTAKIEKWFDGLDGGDKELGGFTALIEKVKDKIEEAKQKMLEKFTAQLFHTDEGQIPEADRKVSGIKAFISGTDDKDMPASERTLRDGVLMVGSVGDATGDQSNKTIGGGRLNATVVGDGTANQSWKTIGGGRLNASLVGDSTPNQSKKTIGGGRLNASYVGDGTGGKQKNKTIGGGKLNASVVGDSTPNQSKKTIGGGKLNVTKIEGSAWATLKAKLTLLSSGGGKKKKNAIGGIILNRETLLGYDGSGRAQVAGEAGREAILPLDYNTQWMDKVAGRVASAVNMGGGYADAAQTALLQEQNRLLTAILNKDTGVEITTAQITGAFARMNRRAGVAAT